jgi:signal transduction histidine kinase
MTSFAASQRPPAPQRWWRVYLVALAAVMIASVALNGAVRWYGHPFAEVLVDADAVVSAMGSPAWASVREGLRFPDRMVAVDGQSIERPRGMSRGTAFNKEVERAAAAGHPSVHVSVQTIRGTRLVELPISRFGAAEWWLDGGVLLIAAALYVLAALTALVASPNGKLARTFAKAALIGALFLFTIFDVQTSRDLVPLWQLSFAMAPGAFASLALRLPDDAPLLERWPWVVKVLDGLGVSLGAAMLILDLVGEPTTPVQSICTILLGASQIFFGTTFLVRFARARGERRAVMRALLAAVAPPHALLGLGILLSMLSSRGSSASFSASLPVLSLMPFSAVVAFIRHDLWGSRALLSRVMTLTVAGGIACMLALAVGAAFVTSLGVPFQQALLGTAAGAIASAALVTLALRVSDRGFFPSRAEYKPTVEQLSDHLTAITDPEDVARAVERTVRRWLACDYVHFVARAEEGVPSSEPIAFGAKDLSLPVSFRGEVLGVLHVGTKSGGALFTSEDLDLLRTIANQTALALAHAHSYRELEERRRQQAAAWRGERIALIETLAAEIAHEVRYPINYFRSVFQRGTKVGRLDAEDIEIGCEEVDRLERLVSGLRRVAHHRLERRVVPLAELAARAEVLLRDALGHRALDVDIPEGAALRCDVDQGTQVVVNLLSNALDAAGPDGRVGLAWRLRASESGGLEGAELVVWDNGPGFDGDVSQLFAPWFTTKPRGTGLGLAITQRIVRAHGWSIDARRVEGRTLFVISIPTGDLIDSDEPTSEEEPAPQPVTTH